MRTLKSIGGRDEFLNREFVKIVDSDPEKIAKAVADFEMQPVDPEYIRQKTIERILYHREKFLDLIQKIFDENGSSRNIRSEWPALFFNKLYKWQTIAAVREQWSKLAGE